LTTSFADLKNEFFATYRANSHSISSLKFTVDARKMYRLEKCWEIKECHIKEKCPVFPHFGRSCSLIRGKLGPLFIKEEDTNCHETCESCEV